MQSMALLLLSLTAAPEPVSLAPASLAAGAASTGTRWQALTANFEVQSFHPNHDARRVAAHCEQWRAKLQAYWGKAAGESWTPRCRVVVHADRQAYLSALGAGAASTFGSSWIEFAKDKRVARRQIDFRGDQPHGLAAVPHELTHVVLADHLGGRQPPRWADEGMALLADGREKQLLHERDLASGLANRLAFRVVDLLSIESYPHPARIPAFYGQSVSLTAFLALRDNPEKFVEFLRRSLDEGYDQALSEVYAIPNVVELERLWQAERATWQSGYHGVCLALEAEPGAGSQAAVPASR